jgi:hypothetical protein
VRVWGAFWGGRFGFASVRVKSRLLWEWDEVLIFGEGRDGDQLEGSAE